MASAYNSYIMQRKPINALSEQQNVLSDVHDKMLDLPILFRQRVCTECGWSTPTFYRKMRQLNKKSRKGSEDKLVPGISIADKEKIMAVAEEIYKEFWAHCDKYRKKGSKD